MRILWLTNIPVGSAGELFFGKKSNGLWMDAALEGFWGDSSNSLFIATTGQVRKTQVKSDGTVTYYLLPDRTGYEYRCGKKANLAAMEAMLQEIRPDIIQIWGTEMQAAIDLVSCNCGNIPTVVYIQGVVGSLARYFKAGMTEKDILVNYTPMDILRGTGIYQQIKRYRHQAEMEKIVVQRVRNVIGENMWSRAYYRAICSGLRFYDCPLPLNRCFAEQKWDAAHMIRHSVMCNSSPYSIKGVHILLKAMEIVKKNYPDVRLYIPGDNPAGKHNFKDTLRQTGYIRYLKKEIKKMGLTASIEFLPLLTLKQMAQQMAGSNVFVVSSAIENHSSSLKEAMLVGVPSIGTYVGGVPEYLHHGENGFMYRFEEPEVLADLICEIFASDDLAGRMSCNARRDMMTLHMEQDLHKRTLEIYQQIIEAK